MQAGKLNQLQSNKKPEINILKMKKIDFHKDQMVVYLFGGRILSVPLYKFPFIKKLTLSQRKAYHISGGISLDFEDCDEVYHINELLGIDHN